VKREKGKMPLSLSLSLKRARQGPEEKKRRKDIRNAPRTGAGLLYVGYLII
jgi:hypothetical protein